MKLLYVVLALYFFISTPAYADATLYKGQRINVQQGPLCGTKEAAVEIATAHTEKGMEYGAQHWDEQKAMGNCGTASYYGWIGNCIYKGVVNVVEVLDKKEHVVFYIITQLQWAELST